MRSVRCGCHWMIGFCSSHLETAKNIKEVPSLPSRHTLLAVCFATIRFIWLRCVFLSGMFRVFDEGFLPRRSFVKMVPFLRELLYCMARFFVICFLGPLEFDITWMSTSRSSSEETVSWFPVLRTTVRSISLLVSTCPFEHPSAISTTSACPITFSSAVDDREGQSMECVSWCSSLVSRQELRSFHLSRNAVKTDSAGFDRIQMNLA